MIEPWQKSRQNGVVSVTPVMSWITDLLGADHRIHDNWVASWSRRSCRQSYGRAQTCRNQSNVWHSRKLLHVTLKFETKILRSDWFVQVNFISVAPMLQFFWGSVSRRRQSGKSKVPAKQRGGWPKCVLKLKEQERATFFSPSENRCLPASTLKPEEREFCCGLRSVDAYDQQKGLEWCWNGYLDEIV